MSGHALIIDYGSQYTQLIARKTRAAGYYAEILPAGQPLGPALAKEPGALILSGGPASVNSPGAPTLDPAILASELPILGVCYGMQLLTQNLGGRVGRAPTNPEASDGANQIRARQTGDPQSGDLKGGEYGPAEFSLTVDSPLWAGLGPRLEVWMSHGDSVTALPPDFEVIGQTRDLPRAAMASAAKKIYGLQFHPEVHHTQGGERILLNFLRLAGLEPTWRVGSLVETLTADLARQIGDGQVLLALSGGVDSTVAAALLSRAIGKNLHCVFVDNGLLRHQEAQEVKAALLGEFPDLNLIAVDAAQLFLSRLRGVTDPEKKREIIGQAFVDVFTAEAKKLGPIEFLAQGTLYPDVIESSSPYGPSAMIKGHHNVRWLSKDLAFTLVEPLRDLFKDEVRVLGASLGLPEKLLWRHPFPGPGLAIRILGEVTEEALAVTRQADKIILEELERSGLAREVWQAFAVLLPVKSVGVMGDGRSYLRALAIRAVTSVDAMTADWARLPDSLLARWSSRLINEVPGINRVLYDISTKPPSTIEWE
ncbi:MAG: glutamine-hydrolyzing GMP synthase [Deltaproteobacteria bacterium]|jgi:GMP synthase (glutamine-hydrolysing)|nr:glutamine-hydrolyzing GMP synthase [Deltaproteobacteria bacterium]